MSVKSLSDAWDYSPFKGSDNARFLVHLAVADVVNEHNDWELRMLRDSIAEKAGVSRGSVDNALRDLVKLGWLRSTGRLGGPGGGPTTYRYDRMDPRNDCASDEGESRNDDGRLAQSGGSSPSSNASEPKTPAKPRPRNFVFDALVHVYGEPAGKSEAAFYGKTVAEMTSDFHLDPHDRKDGNEVVRRARRCLARFPGSTPKALVMHWRRLGREEPAGRDEDMSGLATKP